MTAYPGGDTAVNGMLQGAWRGGVRSFWMVGTGDLRPSLMELNLTGALWCTPDTDCAAQRRLTCAVPTVRRMAGH